MIFFHTEGDANEYTKQITNQTPTIHIGSVNGIKACMAHIRFQCEVYVYINNGSFSKNEDINLFFIQFFSSLLSFFPIKQGWTSEEDSSNPVRLSSRSFTPNTSANI